MDCRGLSRGNSCYRILGLKVLEKSYIIKMNINMINQYLNKYKARFKRMIKAG